MDFYSRASARLNFALVRTNDRSRRTVSSETFPLTPWLAVERFEYEGLEDRSALVQLLGSLDATAGFPGRAMLVVTNGTSRTSHQAVVTDPPYRRSDAACVGPGTRQDRNWRRHSYREPANGLLWHASFAVPLEVVEYPDALFTLTADVRVALALPAPHAVLRACSEVAHNKHFSGARIRRHLIAVATSVAIAATSGSAVAVAAADTTTNPGTDITTTTTTSTTTTETTTTTADSATDTPSAPDPSTTSTTTTTTPTPPVAATPTPPVATTPTPSVTTTSTPSVTTTSTSAPTTPPPMRQQPTKGAPDSTNRPHPTVTCKPALPRERSSKVWTKDCPTSSPDQSTASFADHGKRPKHSGAHRKHHKPAHHHSSHRRVHESGAPAHRVASPHRHGRPDSEAPRTSQTPTTVTSTAPTVAPWTAPVSANPFTTGEFSGVPSVGVPTDQPPPVLIPIYKSAAKRYHVPWQILAAINSVETDYGRNLSVSSAGAIGWMQFIPAAWQQYGVAADGHGRPDPYDPHDAILSAARYLAANGARHDLRRAIFAYNHAGWYVELVVRKAQEISAVPFTSGKRAKLLPDGRAAAPTGAPAAVKAIIAAGNEIAGKPYVYGAAHGFPLAAIASAYDCSSSVDHLLYGARQLPINDGFASGALESFGQPGPGRWVTLYASAGHVFMYVAGLRWDTHNAAGPGDGSSGIGWHPLVRSSDGFIARHPAGL
jgi:hypothetical protein